MRSPRPPRSTETRPHARIAGLQEPGLGSGHGRLNLFGSYATVGGHDVARMYDSAGDDVFEATPTETTLYRSDGGDEYFNTAKYFEAVHGFSPAWGYDTAML